jgi:hypothetical protein
MFYSDELEGISSFLFIKRGCPIGQPLKFIQIQLCDIIDSLG